MVKKCNLIQLFFKNIPVLWYINSMFFLFYLLCPLSTYFYVQHFFESTFFIYQRFVLVGIFYSWCYFQSIFLLFNVLSQSTFLHSKRFLLCNIFFFAPDEVFYLQPFLPVDVFPFNVLSQTAFFGSTFYPSMFFTIGFFYFGVLALNRLFLRSVNTYIDKIK
jgi:hypothetical protein